MLARAATLLWAPLTSCRLCSVRAAYRYRTGLQGRDISRVWRGESGSTEEELAHGRGDSRSAELAREASDSVYLQNMANGWPDRNGWVGRWRGVRTERWTYTRWYANERGPWLFDRAEDPLEMVNLADAAEARPALEEMEARLHRWMEVTHDPFDYGRTRCAGISRFWVRNLQTPTNIPDGALRNTELLLGLCRKIK